MGPNLLLRVIATALFGAGGVWALQVLTPLQDSYKQVLQGAVVLATLATMARMGGIW